MADKMFSSSYVREWDGKRVQLSGNAYVPMRCWEYGNQAQFTPVLVKLPHRCNHGDNNVCIECVVSWSWDHQIAFSRTVAGRNLLSQIQADPHINKSVHFVDRDFVAGEWS